MPPSDEEFLAYNETVIEGFRGNDGEVAQLGFPVLLLTTTGAKTGRRTTVPLAYGIDEGRLFVVASKAGAPTNPAWYHNLVSHPSVTVEIGTSTYEAQARVTEGAERDRLYRIVAADSSAMSSYEQNTSRRFPVIVLEGVPAPPVTAA